MNQKAALAKALLAGEVVSIMTCFKMFGMTNAPREIGRAIERPFGVTVSKTRKMSKTRYGGRCVYFEYRLNSSLHNLEGIAKMLEYVKKHTEQNSRTKEEAKEKRQLDQITLFNSNL